MFDFKHRFKVRIRVTFRHADSLKYNECVVICMFCMQIMVIDKSSTIESTVFPSGGRLKMEMLRSWKGHVVLNPLEGSVALIIHAAGFGDPEMHSQTKAAVGTLGGLCVL